MIQVLRHSSIVGLLSMVVALLPLAAGIAYAVRPSEQRLALMRPVSLAGIFGALTGTLAGTINVLQFLWTREPPVASSLLATGAAEALVPLLLAFGCLTVAWLCVAIGLRRQI